MQTYFGERLELKRGWLKHSRSFREKFFKKTTLPLRRLSDLSVTTPRTVRSCASCFLSCAVAAVASSAIAATKQQVRRSFVILYLP